MRMTTKPSSSLPPPSAERPVAQLPLGVKTKSASIADPSRPSSMPTSSKPPPRSWLSLPRPLKTFFDKFPLVTYPPNPAPASTIQFSNDKAAVPRLYIFREKFPDPKPDTNGGGKDDDDEDDGDAIDFVPFTGRHDLSFNPTCLKYQAYLKFRGIQYLPVPSNTHASPNGSLPFLIVPQTSPSRESKTLVLSSDQIQGWADQHDSAKPQGDRKIDTPEADARDISASTMDGVEAAYASLIDHRIRRAWLFSLYLTSNFDSLVTPLWIKAVSNSSIVQTSVAHSLRHSAQAELLQPSSSSFPNFNYISSLFHFHPSAPSASLPGSDPASFSYPASAGVLDVPALLAEAKEAFVALDEAIRSSRTGWLSGKSEPGLLDAALFGYVYLLLAPVFVEKMLEENREGEEDTEGESRDQSRQRPRWSNMCLHDLLEGLAGIQAHCQKIGNRYFSD